MWHYVKNNKANGPIKIIEIEALIKKNEIKRDTKVWREGMSDWQNAMNTELQSRFPQNTPNKQPRKSKPKNQPTTVDDHSNRNPKEQPIDMNVTREIIDYLLITSEPQNMGKEVLRFINTKKGWQPYGNPFFIGDYNVGNIDETGRDIVIMRAHISQAMVIYR